MKWPGLLILFISFLFWQGCATVKYQENISNYRSQIQMLQERLQKHPDDAQALRELGAIYFQTRQYAKAKDYLTKAYKVNPQDAKTLFYLGLSLEFENKNQSALKIYGKYGEISRLSPWRKKMEGRYKWLTRQMIKQEMKALLRQEAQLGTERITPRTVAVFPLAYVGKEKKYAPLGEGLAEMMITDLSQVHDLKVVERVRLQALLEEMALGQKGLVDPKTAPRFGRLLGAAKLVRGQYLLSKGEKIRLDVVFWDVLNRHLPVTTSQSDVLNNLFKLEKDIVFKVIDEMGIELTPQERERIQRIPTKNMQAFLAYCMGLEQEDAGNFEAANRFYQKAIKLDPGFKMAGQKAEEVSAISQAGGSKEQLAAQMETPAGKHASGSKELVNNRLLNLNASMGATFLPGQDRRKPAEDVNLSTGGEMGIGKLPEPPQPPGGR